MRIDRRAWSKLRLRGTERLFWSCFKLQLDEKEGESFITEPEECIHLGQRRVGVRGDVQLVRFGSPCCSKASWTWARLVSLPTISHSHLSLGLCWLSACLVLQTRVSSTCFSLFGDAVRTFEHSIHPQTSARLKTPLFVLLIVSCVCVWLIQTVFATIQPPLPHVNRSLFLRLSSFCDSGASTRGKTWPLWQTIGGLLTSQLDGYCGPSHPLNNLDQFEDKTSIKSIRRQTVVNKIWLVWWRRGDLGGKMGETTVPWTELGNLSYNYLKKIINWESDQWSDLCLKVHQ